MLGLAACSVSAPPFISEINSQVNAHPYGNGFICKQYVDTKYHVLFAAGVSAGDMTVLYGITDKLEQHVELEVISSGEIYILDNRYNKILSRPDMVVTHRIMPDSSDWQYVLSGPHYY